MNTPGPLDVDVDAFWRDGFAVVRGVYSGEQISEFRRQALQSRPWMGDLLTHPELDKILLDGNLVRIARKILGRDDIIYGGDSSFTVDSDHHFWHKDNTDREDGAAPDWASRYTMLRFGIYLQDHTHHSKGLIDP